MRRRKNNFFGTVRKEKVIDSYYDLYRDWGLIEASFAQQYGIRLRKEKMSWSEFTTLLAGLNGKTPLGEMVSIRSESDPEIVRNFSPQQKKIRSDWRSWIAQKQIEENPEGTREELEALHKALEAAFGGDGEWQTQVR